MTTKFTPFAEQNGQTRSYMLGGLFKRKPRVAKENDSRHAEFYLKHHAPVMKKYAHIHEEGERGAAQMAADHGSEIYRDVGKHFKKLGKATGTDEHHHAAGELAIHAFKHFSNEHEGWMKRNGYR